MSGGDQGGVGPEGPSSPREPTSDHRLSESIYGELKDLAGRVLLTRKSPSLHATAVVHAAWLRLAGTGSSDVWSESHFKAAAAVAMKHVVADHLRARHREKRGGGWERVTLAGIALEKGRSHEIDAEALQDALSRFAALDPRAAHIVELRFFGGLAEPAIAEVLGVSERTVRNDWAMARAWLRAALADPGASPAQS